MESANLHHHRQQQQHQHQDDHHHHHLLLQPSSPLQTTPSTYGLGTTTYAWTPNNINTHSIFNPNTNGDEDSRHHQNDYLVPSPMVQELGVHWANSNNSNATAAASFNSNSSTSSMEDFQLQPSAMKNDQEREFYDMSEKMLLRNLSSSGNCQINGFPIPAGPFLGGGSRGNFSQIFPTINISNMNGSSSAAAMARSSEMNMQALDLFNSGTFSGFLSQSSYGLDQMQQSSKSKLSSALVNSGGATEAKRSNNFLEPKVAQAAQKKSRSDSRASCPPFKVRKEKLGDRIAALQQLVAPFGKTDTASVLMEAIGYIKFLQNQVETLSVPYMKRNRTPRTIRGDLIDEGNGEGARQQDLRSRGLCLVPVSCLSYVTDGTGAVWPLPNFSPGGT